MIVFESSSDIVAYAYCAAEGKRVKIFASNTSGKCDNSLHRKVSFTEKGRLVLTCTSNNNPFTWAYPVKSDSLKNGIDRCVLKYFNGNLVCMYNDGNIAYSFPEFDSNNSECARASSFKISGYTNPNEEIGDTSTNIHSGSLPPSCVKKGASCHLRVCNVDTLEIPASVDISLYSFLNDAGEKMPISYRRGENAAYKFELQSTSFGGRSIYPNTPVSDSIVRLKFI